MTTLLETPDAGGNRQKSRRKQEKIKLWKFIFEALAQVENAKKIYVNIKRSKTLIKTISSIHLVQIVLQSFILVWIHFGRAYFSTRKSFFFAFLLARENDTVSVWWWLPRGYLESPKTSVKKSDVRLRCVQEQFSSWPRTHAATIQNIWTTLRVNVGRLFVFHTCP